MSKIKFLIVTALMIFTVALTGCGTSDSGGKSTVAICFPNTTPSWQRNSSALQEQLTADGFNVEIQSSSTIEEQQKQIKETLQHKPNCMVIGAIDSAALVDVLEDAKNYNVPIIAFDRIILNTDAVSYYASFDNDAIGEAQGLYFEAAMNLRNGGGPYNIEFFAGGPADNNAHIFFDKVMEILNPYIKSGQLVCRSGQTDFNSAAVKDWNSENARPRIREILTKYYSGGETLHAILAPNDDIAGVILEEIQKAGRPAPLISGLDGDPKAYERIKNGLQTFTVAKDPDVLTAKCFRMVKAVVEGVQPDINDVTTYNNGVKIVPAYLCTPQIVDKTNVNDF